MMKAGRTEVSAELLGKFLRLPNGCRVESIQPTAKDGYFEFLLIGEGMPEVGVPEVWLIMQTIGSTPDYELKEIQIKP